MSVFAATGILCAAGAVGGIINAFMSNNGRIPLPNAVKVKDPNDPTQESTLTFQPGILGNVLIGAFAAGINWGLYGPFTSQFVFGSGATVAKVGVTLAALATAALVGLAGARWLTNEVDKKLLQATASMAASRQADASAGARLAVASPAAALSIAQQLKPAG